ncbi:hypothetical protein K438DRAFT_1982330 [Mycena galopus ATCC 62051]|nr:hypothetical protein K438DRAFT_1982330 [Mycena galopus ATCC 62051]
MLLLCTRLVGLRSRMRVAVLDSRWFLHTATYPPPEPPTSPPQISTLNPALLSPSNYLDLSGKLEVPIHCLGSQSGAASSIGYASTPTKKLPFPEFTDGFLYYHRDQDAAPLEGAVRMRIRGKKPPWTFINGRDLLLPSGCPWQIILPQIASSDANYDVIRNQLLADKLVTETELWQCHDIFGDKRIDPETTLFHLTQEFPVDFNSESLRLNLVGANSVHRLDLGCLFVTHDKNKSFPPWRGSARACLEPSTIPEHIGRRVINLRFKEATSRVICNLPGGRYKGILKPRAGIFLLYTRRGGLAPVKWEYDIDTDTTPAGAILRYLWDRCKTIPNPPQTEALG